MKVYLNSPFSNNEVRIGGGMYTAEHISSGGYRYDIVPTGDFIPKAIADMDFIMFASNYGSYAVYRLTGTNLYVFYVHVKNVIRGHIKRGDRVGDLLKNSNGYLYLHLHIKDGSYLAVNKKYIDWMYYLDPKTKVTYVNGIDSRNYLDPSGKPKQGQKAIIDLPEPPVNDPTEILKKEIDGLKNEVSNLKIEKAKLQTKVDYAKKDLTSLLDTLNK